MANTNSKKSRGKPKQYTDDQLKQMALDIKYQIGGAKVTFSLMEQKTGISRNTFQRRIGVYITEINTPIIRELGISDKDAVYYPNFEKIYEAYGHDPKKLIHEMHKLEVTFYDIMNKLSKTNKESIELEVYKEQLITLKSDVNKYKGQADFYKNLYESIVVSSIYVDKRKELGIANPLIDFKEHITKNNSLKKLDKLFPDSIISNEMHIAVNKQSEEIKSKFPNLFIEDDPD